MPKTPGQASYLQRRGTARYFRFRLPSQIHSVALAARHLEAKKARAEDDSGAEEEFIAYEKRAGYSSLSSTQDAPDAGATLRKAWQRYYAEKTAARPQPDWSASTAQAQQATFVEFSEIVGNLAVKQLTRDVILDYLEKVARFPKRLKQPGLQWTQI